MNAPLLGISSMATRPWLAAVCEAIARQTGASIRFESVGGVDAAARVAGGEAFDLVVLAADALDKLAAAGHVVAASLRPLALSQVAIAVPAGAVRPDVRSEPALRAAVLAASRIGYSTGPSGVALLQLFARWGLLEPLRERLVQARPGVPVAALLARGQAELGFQQLSELKDEPGIALLGTMPPGLEIVTTFSGAVGAHSTRAAEASEALDFITSPAADDLRSLHGMTRPT